MPSPPCRNACWHYPAARAWCSTPTPLSSPDRRSLNTGGHSERESKTDGGQKRRRTTPVTASGNIAPISQISRGRRPPPMADEDEWASWRRSSSSGSPISTPRRSHEAKQWVDKREAMIEEEEGRRRHRRHLRQNAAGSRRLADDRDGGAPPRRALHQGGLNPREVSSAILNEMEAEQGRTS